MENKQDLKLAVLIDADNVPSSNVKGMMEEIAKYGVPTFKRIYGDWTSTQSTKWKAELLENSLIPIQQFSNTVGKGHYQRSLFLN
jgi:hypothetical protein